MSTDYSWAVQSSDGQTASAPTMREAIAIAARNGWDAAILDDEGRLVVTYTPGIGTRVQNYRRWDRAVHSES